MHLYLIRHGQSTINLPNFQASAPDYYDPPLTELGHQQAAALAEWIVHEVPAPDVIYASTMQRTRQTVAPLAAAYQQNIIFDDRIRELGNNYADHRPIPAEQVSGDTLDNASVFAPFTPSVSTMPDSESWNNFRDRVGTFIEEIARKYTSETVLVVCHGGVINAAVDYMFNVGVYRRCQLWNFNTGITYFERLQEDGQKFWRMHYHSRAEHLITVEGMHHAATFAATKRAKAAVGGNHR